MCKSTEQNFKETSRKQLIGGLKCEQRFCHFPHWRRVSCWSPIKLKQFDKTLMSMENLEGT